MVNIELKPSVRSNFTRPLILELIAQGQGKEVLELLHSVGLEVTEITRKPYFKITEKR